MPTVIKGQPSSKEVLQTLADMHKPVALSFSCGKDSIATWIAMREYGIEVVPVYFWYLPNLKFINDSLDYYERAFGRHIHRYPNPSFYGWIMDCVDQSPERVRVIQSLTWDGVDYDDMWPVIFDDLSLPHDTWKADGVRAADSLVRRSSFVQHGVMKQGSHKVSPIADWLKDEVMAAISGAGIKLPIDYELFGRSFDGIDRRFTEPMRRHLPEDYARLKEWFPLIDSDIIRWGADPNGF